MADYAVRGVGVLVVSEARRRAVRVHVYAVHPGGIVGVADLADLVRGCPRCIRVVAQAAGIAGSAARPGENDRLAVSRQPALGRIRRGYGAFYTFDVGGVLYVAGLAGEFSVLSALDAPASLRLPSGRG